VEQHRPSIEEAERAGGAGRVPLVVNKPGHHSRGRRVSRHRERGIADSPLTGPKPVIVATTANNAVAAHAKMWQKYASTAPSNVVHQKPGPSRRRDDVCAGTTTW
jgi:hypothetical protein